MELADDIKELLLESGKVIIPNFGGFTSNYQPAVIDSISGQIQPPALQLAFDPNLQINDGVLVDFLRHKHRVTATAAQELIAAFVTDMQSLFSKSEIVILPEVGRLYRDFAGKIQFLPDSTNFNTNSFGLPTLKFEPVSRHYTKPVAAEMPPSVPMVAAVVQDSILVEKPADTVIEKPYQVPQSVEFFAPEPNPSLEPSAPLVPEFVDKPMTFWEKWKEWMPAIAATFVALLAISIWWLTNNSKPQNTEGVAKLPVEQRQVNASPLGSNVNVAPNAPMASENVAPPPIAPPPVEMPKKEETDKASKSFFTEKNNKKAAQANVKPPIADATPNRKTATVTIGAFANKGSIQRIRNWVNAQGYTLTEQKRGGLTVVNCAFKFDSKTDFNQTMARLRTEFGNDINVTTR